MSSRELFDSYRHKGLREKLVEELMDLGIKDEAVLSAILKIPRHFFFENAFMEKAYRNMAFPIGSGQTISHPLTVAYQSELLEAKAGQTVLEIGTGSGYQASILAQMGLKVVSIERHQNLHLKAKLILRKMGYHNIKLIYGDGFAGAPGHAPFDRILVTAAAPFIPDALLQQLAINGRMIIPVNTNDNDQEMQIIVKKGETEFYTQEGGTFRFVPMKKGTVND